MYQSIRLNLFLGFKGPGVRETEGTHRKHAAQVRKREMEHQSST